MEFIAFSFLPGPTHLQHPYSKKLFFLSSLFFYFIFFFLLYFLNYESMVTHLQETWGGSTGKESTCNAGDLGSIPGLGRFPWRRERLPTTVFWPGEFHGLYSPWGGKELDTAEQVSLSLSGKCRAKLHIVPLYITTVF